MTVDIVERSEIQTTADLRAAALALRASLSAAQDTLLHKRSYAMPNSHLDTRSRMGTRNIVPHETTPQIQVNKQVNVLSEGSKER